MPINRIILSCLMLVFIHSISSGQALLLHEDFSSANGNQPPIGWKYALYKGNSAYDSFQFSNIKYTAPEPFQGKFALFDVYEGGSTRASNGDGFTENASLISPLIHSDSALCFLSFDYFFTKLRSPIFYVELSKNSGSSWIRLWADSIGNSRVSTVELAIDTSITQSKDFIVRFRWETKDNQTTQGYLMFDNVRFYNRLENDVSNSSPTDSIQICRDSKVLVVRKTKNECLETSFNIRRRAVLFNPSHKVVWSKYDTLSSLPPLKTYLDSIPLGILQEIGMYKLEFSCVRQDSLPSNDTSWVFIEVLDTANAPKSADVHRCGVGRLLLQATSTSQDSILWLSNRHAFLGMGESFISPIISTSDTFYAQSARLFPYVLSTHQGPYRFNGLNNGGSYIQITAKSDIAVNALHQHFGNADSAIVKVFYKSGSYKLHEKNPNSWSLLTTDTVHTKGWGSYATLDIPDQILNRGDTISFYIVCQGKASFTFKKYETATSDLHVDFFSDAVNSNLFSNSGPLYRPFSWDGKVSYSLACKSKKTRVLAAVIQRPKGVKLSHHSTFSGVVGQGTISKPDHISEKGNAIYLLSSPNGYTNSSYGKNWSVKTIAYKSSSGVMVPDSFYWALAPNMNGDFQSGFSPNGSWVDSIICFSAVVVDHIANCDTLITRCFRISKTPAPTFNWQGACASDAVLFTNTTDNFKQFYYQWKMGDGMIYSSPHALHKYFLEGQYVVKLLAFNQFGISGEIADTVTVYKKPQPNVKIQNACENHPVKLIMLNFKDYVGLEYSIYEGKNVLYQHVRRDTLTFSFPASKKTLGLIVNNHGCTDSSFINVFQFPVPKAKFNVRGSCQYDTLHLENLSSIPSQEKLGYRWFEGADLISTFSNPSLVQSKSGQLSYKLIVESQFSCSDTFEQTVQITPTAKSNFSLSLACNNEVTQFYNKTMFPKSGQFQYLWDFGDGKTSKDSSPIHYYSGIGEHLVRLTTTTNNLCKSTYASKAIVRVQPIAEFAVQDVCSQQEAVFVNRSKIENKILKYRWSFGDGDTSNVHSPRHVYRSDSTESFRVRLEVFLEDNSCRDEFSAVINVLPLPSCGFESETVNNPLHLRFIPKDTTLTTLTWSFEGGGISEEKTPEHAFQVPGRYLVRLFGRTKNGCLCREEQIVDVGTSSTFFPTTVLKVSVYPNPTEDFIFVEEGQNYTYRLLDVNGKTVKELTMQNSGAISLQDVHSGIYFLEVKSNDVLGYFKIAKI